MNDFDKTFGLVFYNSFLKIKLNCDKENMLILNTCKFEKKMLSNLPCMYSDSLIDSLCVLKTLQNLQKYIMTEFTVKEATVFID